MLWMCHDCYVLRGRTLVRDVIWTYGHERIEIRAMPKIKAYLTRKAMR